MNLEFKPLTMMELRSAPGDILDKVYKEDAAFVIERNGLQIACLVPVSVLLPDIKKSIFNNELSKLKDNGESPKINISDSNEIEMEFLETIGSENLSIKIVLPHGYPNIAPKVYAYPLVEKTPHCWQDGSLCIFGASISWNPGQHDIAFVLKQARLWSKHYLEWKDLGNWPTESKEENGR